MEPQDERRQFVRLNFSVDVIYHKVPPVEKEKLSLAKNISTGGICLIVYEELREQDALDLEIYLPEDKTAIQAKGRVIWVKEFIIGDISKGKRYDVGIDFLEINKNDLERINKYVFSHL